MWTVERGVLLLADRLSLDLMVKINEEVKLEEILKKNELNDSSVKIQE